MNTNTPMLGPTIQAQSGWSCMAHINTGSAWAVVGAAGKGFGNGPAKNIKAFANSAIAKAGFFGPLHHGFGLPLERQASVVRAVVLLLFHCGPSTVSRLVALGVVDAVNGVLGRWHWPHVPQEGFVGRTPKRANRRGLFISSVVELAPNLISASLLSALRVTMLRARSVRGCNLLAIIANTLEPCRVHVFGQAAARRAIAEHKTVSWKSFDRPALASALPDSITGLRSKAANSCQSVEFLARQIFCGWHSYRLPQWKDCCNG